MSKAKFSARLAQCGHLVKRVEVLSFGQKDFRYKFFSDDIQPAYCARCLEEMTIVCGHCGRPIFVGDQITFFRPVDKDYQPPDKSFVIKLNPLVLVACLRISCTLAGSSVEGYWVAPGHITRISC